MIQQSLFSLFYLFHEVPKPSWIFGQQLRLIIYPTRQCKPSCLFHSIERLDDIIDARNRH